MPLTGESRKILREALLDAYQSHGELNRMVYEGLDFPLANITGANSNLSDMAGSLITKMSEDGHLAKLIAVARQEKPGNLKLRSAEQHFSLTFDPFSDVVFGDALNASERDAGIEAIVVKASGFENIDDFQHRLGKMESSVCSISYGVPGGGKAYGTGFLVGRDLVMTNYHVVCKAHKPLTLDGNQIKITFDYRNNQIKQTQSSLVRANWLVDYEPRKFDDGRPGLDYALLRLGDALGTQPLGLTTKAEVRGWLPVISQNCALKEPIMILQHPFDKLKGIPSPMKLTIGFIQDVTEMELKHTASTLKGSSGAPVVNTKCELLGIHTSGVDDTANTAKRISAVKGKLLSKGHEYWG